MPQFLVIARDGDDAGAPARRLAAREAHLAGIRPRVERGEIVVGGAILDEATGAMVGSTVVADFPDRAALDAWLSSDPYVTGDVWRHGEVMPVRVAVERGRGAGG